MLVTGGAGFIGSNLAEALAEENDVVILDDLSTGKLDNIKDLQKKNNVHFIKGSITDDRLLHECFFDIDYVFHQAALPSVPRSIKDPQSSVYGDTPSLPKIEDMPVDGLQSCASGGCTPIVIDGRRVFGRLRLKGWDLRIEELEQEIELNDYNV